MSSWRPSVAHNSPFKKGLMKPAIFLIEIELAVIIGLLASILEHMK